MNVKNLTRSLSGVAAVLVLAALSWPVPADAGAAVGGVCPSVAVAPYGSGCAPFFDVPVLKGGYDPGACTLTLTLSGIPGCCNTYLWNRILIIGSQPVAVPVPPFVAGCTLLASPDVILVFPSAQGNTFTIPLPAGLDVTAYIQGVNDYFTTIGFTHDYNWSNGLKVDIG